MKRFSLLVVVSVFAVIFLAGLKSPAASATTVDEKAHPCLHFSNHEYEVCTAYVANSSLAVLLPYYKYGNSSNDTLARYVTYRLGSRYYGDANHIMKHRIAQWPKGSNDVASPTISIKAVKANLANNKARLVTRETWKVTSQRTEKVVYRESDKRHVVIMHRVPSYLLHKWVVVDMR